MKKITATILSTLAFTALCVSGTALSGAQKLPVFAQTPNVTAGEFITPLTSEIEVELIAPTSYEQYLALETPQDVASTRNFVAIADGATLYVFDRAHNTYREYEHTSSIQKIAFDGEENLYFLSELYLYKLTPTAIRNSESATPLNIACKGLFAIDGDTLCYYASNNALKFYSLSSAQEIREVPLETPLQSESPLAFGKDGLYCVCESATQANAYTMYAINLQTYGVTAITNVKGKLRSLTLANNLMCFISQNGDFYSYRLSDLSAEKYTEDVNAITTDKGGYVSLSSLGADVYAIQQNVVRHYTYSADGAAFSEYEIGSSSASTHRLNGAQEVVLNENKLFIADSGNRRVSIYDTETQTFGAAIPTDFETEYLASYQNTLLVASDTDVVVYSLAKRTYGNEISSKEIHTELHGEIVGVASVYGRYYVLTEENYCFMLSKESGDWQWEETHKNTQTLRATAFTADVYGSLYVAYDDDTVYRFTEKQLLNANERGEKILDGLQNPEKIAVDYESSLYALHNGQLDKYTRNDGGMYALNTTYSPDYKIVKDDNPHLQSFAFGLDTEFAYLLYEGDYIVKTDEMQIPKVNPIPVGNAADLFFGDEEVIYSVATIEIDAILIEFDVSMLQNTIDFPYVAFERTQSVQTALKIGEEGEYSILAVAKERTGAYKTCLVLTESCEELSQNAYRTDYKTAVSGYLTNDISLYKFPYLNEILTVDSLTSGTEVTLLGEVIKLDHAYYQIRFTDENGRIKTGFAPKPYITLFDGSTPVTETINYGATETETDAVWRCAFLILGFGAIAILVDFIILYKPKDIEE